MVASIYKNGDDFRVENQKGIEKHKEIAAHLELAAQHHLNASKHHLSGNHDKAFLSTTYANGHFFMALEAQNEDAIHHTTYK